MKKILLSLFLICTVGAAIAQEWTEESIAGTLTVEFPGAVTASENQGMAVKQSFSDKYVAVVQTTSLGDDVGEVLDEDLGMLYDSVVEGMMGSMYTEGDSKEEDITVGGLKARKVMHTVKLSETQEVPVQTLLLITNNRVVSFSYIELVETEDSSQRDRFFSSIKVNK